MRLRCRQSSKESAPASNGSSFGCCPVDAAPTTALRLLRGLTPVPRVDDTAIAWLARRHIDSLYYRAFRERPRAQHVYDTLWKRQREVLIEAAEALEDHGVAPVVAIKGAAFHLRFARPDSIGAMADVDVLVPREQVEKARAALVDAGFAQAGWDEQAGQLSPVADVEIRRREAGHYELFPFGRVEKLDLDEQDVKLLRARNIEATRVAGTAHVAVRLDVHHGIAQGIGGAGILTRSESLGGLPLKLISGADALWVTTGRYYAEVALYGKRSLRDFAYIVGLLADSKIDWNIVGAANEEFELHASLHYYLRFAEWLTGRDLVPPEVIEATSPLRGHRRNDFGWQLGKLFDSLEPPPFDGLETAVKHRERE